MATRDGRGGKRTPPARTPPGGPGRFSRRSERTQPVREPDIDEPDLQYGDRQALTESQKIAPVPAAAAARRTEPRPTGEPLRRGVLPEWLFSMPSANPEEPITAGMDMGPGPGSEALALQQIPDDVREQTLSYLANIYGNADAKMVLAQLRAERARAAGPVMGGPALPATPTAPGGQAVPTILQGQPEEEAAAPPAAAIEEAPL